jgi:hypothetical protein
MTQDEILAWAWDAFGNAKFGDYRNTRRAVAMAAQACRTPAGKVTKVFGDDTRAREAAYDFLENPRVTHQAITHSVAVATACRCVDLPFVIAPVDGTSLSLSHARMTEAFGALGSRKKGRGLKVITSLAISPDGTTLGLGPLKWWNRVPVPKDADGTRQHHAKRSVEQKETQHWLDVVRDYRAIFAEHAPGVRVWWVMDREADGWPLLTEASRNGDWFTIRSKADRRLFSWGSRKKKLRKVLKNQPLGGEYEMQVPERPAHGAHPARAARLARMQMRWCSATLDMRDSWTGKPCRLTVNVLWVREVGTTPHGEKPIDWILLTSHPIESVQDATLVLHSYQTRWRIEEFHRTWKSGDCCVEDNELRSPQAVMKWASILAAVAARAERLKLVSRNDPTLPASVEFTPNEIRVLRARRRKLVKKGTRIPKMPSVRVAVRWTAELGGFAGSYPTQPGSITIARGLETLRWLVAGAELAEDLEKDAPAGRRKRSANRT